MKYIRFIILTIFVFFYLNISKDIVAENIISYGITNNGFSSQSNNNYQLEGTIGQPLTGTTFNSLNTIDSGWLYTLKVYTQQINEIEPPYNVKAMDIPYDNGYCILLTWDISPSEADGLVTWYRIFRSRNAVLTNPVPLTKFASIDSLKIADQYYTILIDSVPAGESEYLDHSVPLNGTVYYYWIQAVGNYSESKKIMKYVETSVDGGPQKLFISDPFPNPFNPLTHIDFYLPESSHMRFSIYNIAGQEIALLKDEIIESGYHTISWNARGLPSGIYFCIIKGDNILETKKMVLLK